MPTVFDEFRKEFDKMPKDEQIQLGMAGLVQMYSGGSEGKSQMSRQFPSRGNGGIDEGRSISGIDDTVSVHIESMDERTMDTLVSKMKRQTYNVRIASVFEDVIDPLAYRMNTNMLKNQIFRNRLHYENVLYYRGIIEAVNGLGGANKENFFEAVSRQYQNFMRHPLWNTMSLFVRKAIMPIANLAGNLLFGFKKKKTDTDRIVDSINEQTEFQRTGKVERESNMFSRLFQTGIVNSLGRNLGGFFTADLLSIESAREARDKKMQGIELTMMEKLSSKMYGKYVDVLKKKEEASEFERELIDTSIDQVNILNMLLHYQREHYRFVTNPQRALPSPNDMGASPSLLSSDKGVINDYFDVQYTVKEHLHDINDNIDKMRRVQATERFMNWFRSGLTIASHTITSIGSAITSGLTLAASSIGAGIAGGVVGAGLALPIALTGVGLYALKKFSDWLTDKLGPYENNTISQDSRDVATMKLAERRMLHSEARKSPAVQALLAEISELEEQRKNLGSHTGPGNPAIALSNRIDALRDKVDRTTERRVKELEAERAAQREAGSTEDLIQFIKRKEGFRSVAYKDGKDKQGNQLYSVGYGNQFIDGKRVTRGQTISQKQADELLRNEVLRRQNILKEGIEQELTSGQLNALTDLAYNVKGGAQTVLDSKMVEMIEKGNFDGAAREFRRWNNAGGMPLPALTERRAENEAMFRGNFQPTNTGSSGPRITESARRAATVIGANANGDDGYARATLQKLNEISASLMELVGLQEGDGTGADGDSLRNLLGR